MARWGLVNGLRSAVIAGAALSLTGCAAAYGAAIGGAVLVAGALAHECYEHVDVTVIDGVTGGRTCKATVTAEQGGDQDELGSCYYAALTEGRWTIKASLPGRPTATTTLTVEPSQSCEPVVASVVLTIPAPGAPAGTPPLPPVAPAQPADPAGTPAPAPPPADPAAPAPGSAPLEPSPGAPAAPPSGAPSAPPSVAPSAAPAPAAPPPAAPAPAASPSVPTKRFE